jgi:hypothetical protein
MKKRILAGLLLAGSAMFAAPHDSFGAGYGERGPADHGDRVSQAPQGPGSGYAYGNGYWRSDGDDRAWSDNSYRRDDDAYRGDNDDYRHHEYRGDDDRRAPERFEHSNRHVDDYRR